MSLQESSGAQILVGIPPIARARGGTASAQDALVHAVQLAAVLLALQVLLAIGRSLLGLEPRLNALVLRVELRHVHDEVFDDVHMRQRRDDGVVLRAGVDGREAGQPIGPGDVHGARPTNALTARPPERQAGVHFVLDFDERVQHHRPALVGVDGVRLQVGLVARVGVPPVNCEVLHVGRLGGHRARRWVRLLRRAFHRAGRGRRRRHRAHKERHHPLRLRPAHGRLPDRSRHGSQISYKPTKAQLIPTNPSKSTRQISQTATDPTRPTTNKSQQICPNFAKCRPRSAQSVRKFTTLVKMEECRMPLRPDQDPQMAPEGFGTVIQEETAERAPH